MPVKHEVATAELDHLSGLPAWWGVPDVSGNEYAFGQMRHFQVFTSNLQQVYGAEYCHQIQTQLSANQRLVSSLQDFLRCRQPQDVIAVEMEIWMTVLEGVWAQTAAWVGLRQKVQDCYAALSANAAVPSMPTQGGSDERSASTAQRA